MTKEEAITELTVHLEHWKHLKEQMLLPCKECKNTINALDMAIEALQIDPIRCRECKYQDECEEVVLFEVNDKEVMGHRLHWCSYAERRKP